MVGRRSAAPVPLVIAGVDEVGRGPLAGPVVAAAVVLPLGSNAQWRALGVADSKALSAMERQRLAAVLRADGGCQIALGAASVAEIDQLNILQATFLAMRRAIARLPMPPDLALIDGNRVPPGLGCEARAIIKGDASEPAIAAASIIAKVVRDRAMLALARRWPGFGWERNMGYPTAEHRQALGRLGPTPHHRRSFGALRQAEMSL
ncbi:MAG: ribonuclease HII [Alphaproteobacteria bacterium]|nr:MAG: ribonuclease HII [Alphaproteobacteria bacterium]